MVLQVRNQQTQPCTRTIFTNGALILKIYSACSFADAKFSSGNFEKTSSASCLSRTHRALLRANLHISVFHACTTHPKVALLSSCTKASTTLQGKSKRLYLLLLFLWTTESGTFKRQSIFPECAVDFHDFQEQIRYSHNGRHVCKNQSMNQMFTLENLVRF